MQGKMLTIPGLAPKKDFSIFSFFIFLSLSSSHEPSYLDLDGQSSFLNPSLE